MKSRLLILGAAVTLQLDWLEKIIPEIDTLAGTRGGEAQKAIIFVFPLPPYALPLFSIAYHADDGKVFMGSGVGGMLRSTNKKLSPMITPQIHLVHDAIRAMLWDVEFYFHETSSRGLLCMVEVSSLLKMNLKCIC